MTEPAKGVGLRVTQVFLNSVEFRHKRDPLSTPPNLPHPQSRVLVELQLVAPQEPRAASAFTLKVESDKSDEAALYEYSVALTIVVESSEESPKVRPVEFLARSGVPTLFPFVREAIANITMRGRFGPLWLNPIDVRASGKELVDELERDGVLTPTASEAVSVPPTKKALKKPSN
jgi:preprotein translocase subunit SecB